MAPDGSTGPRGKTGKRIQVRREGTERGQQDAKVASQGGLQTKGGRRDGDLLETSWVQAMAKQAKANGKYRFGS